MGARIARANIDLTDVGIGILGYGAIAEMHASALSQLGARIVGAAGPNAAGLSAFAARHGIKRTTLDWREIVCDTAVDAVILATPSHLHASQAASALNAGRHVLAEIPLALTLAEAEELTRRAALANRVLAVCHTLRYSEPFIAAKRAIEESGLQPLHVVGRSLGLKRKNVAWTGRPRSWTDNLLWHHGGHTVDAVMWFLGTASAEAAATCGPPAKASGIPMDYSICIRSPDGRVGTIALSYNSLIATNDYLIIGDHESMQLSGGSLSNSIEVLYEADASTVHENAVREQDRDFLDSIVQGATPATSASAILPSMRVIDAIQALCRHEPR